MAVIKIAGIMRAGAYSPNHIGNDAAIFNAVAEQLRKRSCEVNVYSEEQFLSGVVTEPYIISMCREPQSIEMLQKLEDEGRLVINSGYGIENCIRERTVRILTGSNIPMAESIVVDTDEVIKDRITRAGVTKCWIKRGDRHTMHREDVAFARHPQEAQEILQEFFMRGIKRAVICRHLQGELVKFYGITGTPFFYWFYSSDEKSREPSFNLDRLKNICTKAAETLDLKIYGGDCIVDESGNIHLISFNDWPSFVACRNEAAPIIARMVMHEIKQRNK